MVKMSTPVVLISLVCVTILGVQVEGEQVRRIRQITEGPYMNYSAQPLVNLGDNFYYFENNIKGNWYSALEFCRNIDLHLVAIETTEENTLIKDYIATIGFTDYWTGGNDLAVERTWVWGSTGKRVAFTDWHDGEPNNSAGDACIMLRFDKGYLKWNDERPYAEYNIICEQICDANCVA